MRGLGDVHRNRRAGELGEALELLVVPLKEELALTNFTSMTPHSRLVARLLRVLVASVALWTAPALARTADCADVAALIACARVVAPAGHPEVKQASAPARERARDVMPATTPLRAVRAIPAAARTVVVRRRIYLRHAVLLR